jgi:methylmalonyl-CoA mutase
MQDPVPARANAASPSAASRDMASRDMASGAATAWRARVERELAGADFDRVLRTRLAGGLVLEPLYHTRPELPGAEAAPGQAPYLRGGRSAVPDLSQGPPWCVLGRSGEGALDEERAQLLDQLAGGASGLWLRFAPETLFGLAGHGAGTAIANLADLEGLLRGVHLDAVELHLDGSGAALVASAALVAAAERAGVARSALRLHCGADPLGALARDGALAGDLPGAFDDAAELLRTCEATLPASRALGLDTSAYHRAGADPATELGVFAATLAETLRELAARGVPPQRAARQFTLSVELGRELFVEVAKLRALRLLWTRVFAACGVEPPPPYVRAADSAVVTSALDPFVNALRASSAGFAAVVGGVDALYLAPYDEPLGSPSALGRRLARNTQLILAEEAQIGGVLDPAGGSYFLEHLTWDLARAGWALAQELEAEGGVAAALRSGRLQARLQATAATRAREVATRRRPLLGVSEFADLGEALPVDDGAEAELETGAARPAPAPNAFDANSFDANSFDPLVQAIAAGADLATVAAARAGGREPALVAPLAAWREAEPFEELRAVALDWRDAGRAAPIWVAVLGPEQESLQRAAWIVQHFAAGGLEAAVEPLPATTAELGAVLARLRPALVCLCASDARYGTELAPALERLRDAGAAALAVAGRPGEREAEWRAAGAREFLFAGMDAVAQLRGLWLQLGATLESAEEELAP